jgi:hypothetical protein
LHFFLRQIFREVGFIILFFIILLYKNVLGVFGIVEFVANFEAISYIATLPIFVAINGDGSWPDETLDGDDSITDLRLIFAIIFILGLITVSFDRPSTRIALESFEIKSKTLRLS